MCPPVPHELGVLRLRSDPLYHYVVEIFFAFKGDIGYSTVGLPVPSTTPFYVYVSIFVGRDVTELNISVVK